MLLCGCCADFLLGLPGSNPGSMRLLKRQSLVLLRSFSSMRHVNGDVSPAGRPPPTSANEVMAMARCRAPCLPPAYMFVGGLSRSCSTGRARCTCRPGGTSSPATALEPGVPQRPVPRGGCGRRPRPPCLLAADAASVVGLALPAHPPRGRVGRARASGGGQPPGRGHRAASWAMSLFFRSMRSPKRRRPTWTEASCSSVSRVSSARRA
jgi:hypothetical protein